MAEQTDRVVETTITTENRYTQHEGPWNENRIRAEALGQTGQLIGGGAAWDIDDVLLIANRFAHFIRTGKTTNPADDTAQAADV